ncbi:Cu-Zn family superoxide dismutase [Nocardioides aromaticivorans]|uniref:Cu-Zn family superoxide dismutase n=1 Tax=Nocardioides aromaticivorans TaxID=200618 RepID=A0A7Y9ZGT4_9ACTN|nr:gluconolaconase [Nocardioides aromaticivorans]NYI44721.1 Cu-Zn family superoxide dismutase [Nocardioides aromaticivorans]
MKRNHLIPSSLLLATAATTLGLAATATPASADEGGRPASYLLQGDAASPVGSKFEGIGADERRGLFYVSEVTGGEIHRGSVQSAQTEEWLEGDGTDGRFTARGITVDHEGNVYVAGGPNGIGTGRPDLWVYDKEGALLAALRVPGTADAFLNDVAIGRDGAAYFTNSNDPQVFRVAEGEDGWEATLWADATGTITRSAGFNLGGIVLSADRSAFVVAQGNVGRMWRFDSRTGEASEIATDTDLVNADGLVRRGNRLTVVRNFSRMVATLRVSADGSRLVTLGQEPSSADRVLTTAKTLRGRILYVDSKFDEAVASGPYEVVTDPTR